jgi:hypothetical protein
MIFAASVQKRQERITPGGTGGALKNSLDQGDGGAGGSKKPLEQKCRACVDWPHAKIPGDITATAVRDPVCPRHSGVGIWRPEGNPTPRALMDTGPVGYTVLAEAGERRKEEERKKEWGEKKETFVAQHRQGRKIGRVSGPPHGGSNGRGVSRGMGRKEGRRTTRPVAGTEASGASHSHRQGWLLQIADRSGCRGWRGGHGGHEVDRGLQEVDGAEFAGALIPPIVPPIGIRASATADQRDDHQC